jgi:hypothetical protein
MAKPLCLELIISVAWADVPMGAIFEAALKPTKGEILAKKLNARAFVLYCKKKKKYYYSNLIPRGTRIVKLSFGFTKLTWHACCP